MRINNIVQRTGSNKFFKEQCEGENENLIGIFDTSISSLNVGDEIINRSSMSILSDIFKEEQFLKFSTHAGLSSIGIYRANRCKHRIVCGSNLLSGTIFRTGQWNVSPLDVIRLKKHILMGAGWFGYNSDLSMISKMAYKEMLDSEFKHSVRDEYTKQKLIECGITNVINTGCPTTWILDKEHCEKIPNIKSSGVVFTLTDYSKDIINDKKLVEILLSEYENCWFWVQGSEDLEYFKSLDIEHSRIKVIPPQLDAYDSILVNEEVDFIGTRLHAGIRALQHKKRTMIIAIDNRAIEKSKDFNIPIIMREEIDNIGEYFINSEFSTEINIDSVAINEWLEQFN